MLELSENPANLRVLYNTVSLDIDLGSFNEFATRMASAKNRQAFYGQIQPNIDLGDYQTFNKKVSSSYKRPSFWGEVTRAGKETLKKIPAATIGTFAERIAIEGGVLKFGEKLLRSTNPFMIPNMIAEEILPKLPDEQKKKFIEAHPFYQWGRKLKEETKKKIQQDPSLQRPSGYREWTFGNMFAPDKLGETIGNVVPSVLISTGIGVGTAIITKSPIAGLGAAATVAYGMESGFAYDDAIEYGLEPEEASKVAHTVGVINAVLEILPVGRAISKMKIGKQVQRSLAEKLIAKGAYREIPKEMFKQAVTEGATETLQELNSIVQESRYKGKLPSWLEIGTRATQAGFGGFIGGGGVGVVSGVVQQQKARQIIPRIKEQQITDIGYLEKLAPTAKEFKPTLKKPEIIIKKELPFEQEVRKSRPQTEENKSKRIKNVQSRIDRELLKTNLQLKEENPLVRKRTNTLIKEKIKYLKRGERLSELDTREALTDLKMLIIQEARMSLPKSGITTGQIKPLLTQIAKAKNIKDVEAAKERIWDITTKVETKQRLKEIDKLLIKSQPKRIGGKIKARALTADIYKRTAQIKAITILKLEQVDQAIEELLKKEKRTDKEQQILEDFQSFGNLKGKELGDIKAAQEDLQSIISIGKTEKAKLRQDEKNRLNNLKQVSLDVITGKEQGAPMPPHLYQGDVLNKPTGIIQDYLLRQQSFEWLLDIMSRKDKTSGTLDSRLNRHFGTAVYTARQTNNITLNNFHVDVHTFLKGNYKIDGRALGGVLNDNSRKVVNSGVFIRGGEVSISKNEAYKKWMELQDPTLKETFDKEGYTDETVAQLEKFMGKDIMSWAEYQLNELYPTVYKAVNEIFREVEGIDLPFNPFYSPIFREISKDMANVDDPLLRNTNIRSTVENAHLKHRTNSKKALEFRDGDAILQQYLTQMSHYISWAKPIREMRQVLQSAEVSTAVRQYHSSKLMEEVGKHIDDLASGGVAKSTVYPTLDKIRSNFTKAVLGVNPVVFMKQLMSFPAYMMEIPAADFTKGVADFMKNPIKKSKILMSSPMMQARYRVGFERDIILAMKKTTPKDFSETKNLSDTLLFFTKLGDRTAIMFGGWSVYKYHYGKFIRSGMSNKQAHQKALVKFGMATTRAQQAGNVEDLGSIQRMGSWARLFTMFMTAPNQYFRSSYGALRNLKAGRGSKVSNLKRFAIAHWVLPMMFQFAASGFRWENEKQIRAFLVGSLNGLLILGDLIETMVDAASIGNYFAPDAVPLVSAGKTTASGIAKMHKTIVEGFTTEEVLLAIHDIASGVSKVAGIPYDPLYRISSAVVETSKGTLEDPRQLFGYTKYALGLKDKPKGLQRKTRPSRKQRR